MLRSLLIVGLIATLAASARARRPSPASRAKQITREMRRRGASLGEIHLALAALYARAARKRSALRHLRGARRRGIARSRLDLTLGELYRRLGRFDAAFSTFVRVLVARPGQPRALVSLWKTLYEARLRQAEVKTDVDTIREQLAKYGLHFPRKMALVADATPRSKKLTAAGYNALLSRKDRFAAQLFIEAIEAMPSNARAHRDLGIARARQKNYQRAAGAYLLYLELAPDAADADVVDRVLMRYWKLRAKREG